MSFSRFKFSTQRKLRKQPTKMCDVFAVDCCKRSMWEKLRKASMDYEGESDWHLKSFTQIVTQFYLGRMKLNK